MRNRGGPFVNGPSGIKQLKMKLEAGQSVRSMIDVDTVGEERDVEVDSEEDTGFEAVLFGIRNRMRRRSGGHWLLRHAGHQLPQPPA